MPTWFEETFGNVYPVKIEKLYIKLIKAAVNVRPSTPNDLVLIETGLKPLKAVVHGRQLNFYNRFQDSLQVMGARRRMLDILTSSPTDYLRHYTNLDRKFESSKKIHETYMEALKERIRKKAAKGCYKFMMYLKLNPMLDKSPCLENDSDQVTKDIIRFRLGSHYLPIETGRWCRKLRHERLCRTCGTLGDEEHYVYHCPSLDRGEDIPENFQFEWTFLSCLRR